MVDSKGKISLILIYSFFRMTVMVQNNANYYSCFLSFFVGPKGHYLTTGTEIQPVLSALLRGKVQTTWLRILKGSKEKPLVLDSAHEQSEAWSIQCDWLLKMQDISLEGYMQYSSYMTRDLEFSYTYMYILLKTRNSWREKNS